MMDQINSIISEAWKKVRSGELAAAAAHEDAARQIRAVIAQTQLQ